jgi:NAD-dependent DNA ligase
MASKKPTMILLSKTDLTQKEVEQLSDSDAWALIYSLRAEKVKDNRLQVCFTGFGVSQKESLIRLALQHDFNVVKSVTKRLDFLVGGISAGPKKIEKAESQGVQFLTAEQFSTLVTTGEIENI